ncbi:16S rRNA (cytosine(967)-C(5))-methyltransferase RsmB [Xylocopilactobacillus apicola]|uniref:16S rRNA (cytosine(967)-C(5))-methyltransferase n=1 Tax=Xylocopilactobacillus apicola TaxID=2932184 RepID=A0AAU9DBG8_9LACO|nr:16S rRNA (cytosine(967)-C(5))-methyltransferase RsmB [Xylocopilactobacillus apicola]BDR58157.1 ribosomal RNA small subunit methyltransferase B [Xylocopilactobacillus apicola]
MSIKNSVRYLTFLALEEILIDQRYSNQVIDYYLKNYQLSDADRRLFTNLVYGVTFYDLRLNFELSSFLKVAKTDARVLLIIKIAIFQMFYLSKIPDYAAVNEAIEITKVVKRGNVKFVTAVLHQARRAGLRPVKEIKDPIKREAMTYSMPDWLVAKLNDQLGTAKTEAIFQSLLEKPRISLRVNTKKISRDEFLARDSDFYEPSKISPVGVIAKNGSVVHSKEFVAGELTVQDESSQLVGVNLSIKENDVILDACAAPGGKTTHMAQYLSTGVVHAFDVTPKKIAVIKENVNRLGLNEVVETHCADILDLDQVMPDVSFDKILVDAPCSGFGLLRRKPEVKYNHETSDIISAKCLQLDILKQVALHLKPGGLLLYSTCTIFKEETQEVVEDFLQNQPDFKLAKLTTNPKGQRESILQLYPDDYLTDGFFIALMQKKEA